MLSENSKHCFFIEQCFERNWIFPNIFSNHFFQYFSNSKHCSIDTSIWITIGFDRNNVLNLYNLEQCFESIQIIEIQNIVVLQIQIVLWKNNVLNFLSYWAHLIQTNFVFFTFCTFTLLHFGYIFDRGRYPLYSLKLWKCKKNKSAKCESAKSEKREICCGLNELNCTVRTCVN